MVIWSSYLVSSHVVVKTLRSYLCVYRIIRGGEKFSSDLYSIKRDTICLLRSCTTLFALRGVNHRTIARFFDEMIVRTVDTDFAASVYIGR